MKTQCLSFSRHAKERLEQRRLTLSQQEISQLEQAVVELAGKGGKQSLVLLGQLAMVISIDNKKVITVVGQEHLKKGVFTNIDSAAIA